MDAKNTNPQASITTHLEGFLESARRLESTLAEERARSQKIAQEYIATRTALENAVRELQSRLIQRENKIQALTDALKAAYANDERAKREIVEISAREKKSAAALAQYQTAWTEVLAREAQARSLVVEHEKARRAIVEKNARIQELEAAFQQATRNAAEHSRHAETYQCELQTALIRVQSSESKYSQIRKEIDVLSAAKRNLDQEIARIEAAAQERVERVIANERARIEGAAEASALREIERVRSAGAAEIRARVAEIEETARKTQAALESDLASARSGLEESEAARKAESERARARLLDVTEELDRAKHAVRTVVESKATEVGALVERLEEAEEAAVGLRNDASMLQFEAARHKAELESARKESSKALLIERLRFEARVTELSAKIEQLMTTGIYVEKIDAIPNGETVESSAAATDAISPRIASASETAIPSA